MDSTEAVVAILNKLQSLGFCAHLRIPDAAASLDPSQVFDAVLAAFLREAHPGRREARPLPARLGDGTRVDLLRLFASIRGAGGYAAASSSPAAWASAAESAGVGAAFAAPVKLIYAKYLGALDRWIQRLVEAHGPFLDGNGRKKKRNPDQFFDAIGRDCNGNGREQQHSILKRKRDDMVGMLGWVRELAENGCEAATAAAGLADGYLSTALAVRRAVSVKRSRRTSLTSGAPLQEIYPMNCKRCMSSTTARIDAQEKCSKEIQIVVQHSDSDINEFTKVIENMNGSLNGINQENNVTGQGKSESRKHHNSSDGWLCTCQQKNEIPVGSDFQAQVPQWTGELPVNYDNPENLKWLGTMVWPLENEIRKAPYCIDPIGKGREDVCGCNLPGSVECVRFHVAERRLQLRRELGTFFYAWGFDRMGEEIALCWTDEEEANFKTVVQLNAPSSGRNFWHRLELFFRSKGRKELVSYYFNCFLLRRRCYQNRTTPKNTDSDDEDETEFRFLGNRLGHTATKYDTSKHTICIQSTHCMDLNQ